VYNGVVEMNVNRVFVETHALTQPLQSSMLSNPEQTHHHHESEDSGMRKTGRRKDEEEAEK
jgi:hypothetical protein